MPSQRPDHAATGAPSGGSGERARAVGRGLGSGARVTARGAASAARGATRATTRASRYVGRQARRAANAEGAEQSGLNRLFYLHFFNTAGDAAVAISLAGSLFFTVPSGEARGQVALFLGLTMLPFAIVAPLIGPFLDRFSHGRRWAIGSTMAIRAFLCWGLAGAVTGDSAWLFAAALGVLVSSKAYGVTRAAAVPRLLPRGVSLVKANGRVSLSGILGATISAPHRGAGLAGRPGVVAALRLRALRGRHRLRDQAARARRLLGRRGGAGADGARRLGAGRAPRHPGSGSRPPGPAPAPAPASRPRSPSRCAPTAGHAGSAASC